MPRPTKNPLKPVIVLSICVIAIIMSCVLLRTPNEESFTLRIEGENLTTVGETIALHCSLTNRSFRMFWITHCPQIIRYSVNGEEDAVVSSAESDLMYPFRIFDRDISLLFTEPGTYEVVVFSDFTVSLLGKMKEEIRLQTVLNINVE